MRIALLDYGSGNLRSVAKALETCGARVTIATRERDLDEANALVVPGVGSFGGCAAQLDRANLREPVRAWIRADLPYLGICLGYQLLFEQSEESPGARGLGIFPGRVVRFPSHVGKVPHMGWNTLLQHHGALYRSCPPEPWFYFVHSYHPAPDDLSLVSAHCDYGLRFAASISISRLHAVQFHPEKSQQTGLTLLQDFLASATPAASASDHDSTSRH